MKSGGNQPLECTMVIRGSEKKSSSDQLSKVVFFFKKEKKSNVLLTYHSTDTYAKNRYICY